MGREPRRRFALTLLAEAGPPGEVTMRLRRALKALWRGYGLRCVEAFEVPPEEPARPPPPRRRPPARRP